MPNLKSDHFAVRDLTDIVGLTLGDAFRRVVLEDADIQRHISPAIRIKPELECLNSMLSSPLSEYWPVAYERSGLKELFREPILSLDYKEPEWHRLVLEFATVFDQQVLEFLHPLRSGSVCGSGLAMDGTRVIIDQDVWRSESLFVSFHSNCIVRGSGTDQQLLYECLSIVEKSVPGSDQPKKEKRGRPPKHLWDEAFDYAIHKWITEGEPESGTEFATWIFDFLAQRKGVEPPSLREISKASRTRCPRLWRLAKGDQN